MGAPLSACSACARDDETAAALGLQIGATGNLRSLSMRAFTEDEMKGVIAKMG